MSTASVTDREKINAADVLLERGLSEFSGANPAILSDKISVSYAELDAAACRAGHAMRTFDVQPGDRVLIMADDRPEFFYAYLGAMKIGAVPVSLNLRFSSGNLSHVIEDSACKLFLADAQFVDVCQQAMVKLKSTPAFALIDTPCRDFPVFPELMDSQPDTLQSYLLGPDDMALWMYTSGTTGESKAVVHRQSSTLTIDRYLGTVYGVGPGDRIFCSSKLFFAFSLGHSLLASLRLGATTVLHTGWPTAEAVAAVVERHKPDVVLSVPTLYRALLKENLAGSEGFARVRHFISAGEHLPKALSDKWMMATANPILQGIGATEALIMFIGNRPDDNRPGATGKPFPGTKVKLVGESGELISETGIPGVLWVHSDSVAVQYWNQEAKSEQVFKEGWYVTGDVFFRDEDGFYHYQGRDDDMLKISGQWVSPAEIEEYVLKCPDVSDAAVIGVADSSGLVRLALCLIPARPNVDHEALRKELTDTLTSSLSIYKCPRRFIFLDEMPQTATGKTQRFKLRQIAADHLEPAS
ncbi:MAG: benzoate-CoA ligase family protein [Rhodospirillales bacterium]|nr:benzoate-CoA ligase family protein [Rhodospirillales bacterium]